MNSPRKGSATFFNARSARDPAKKASAFLVDVWLCLTGMFSGFFAGVTE